MTSAVDPDEEAFFKLFNMLLWDDDDGQRRFRRHGFFNRPMPIMLRQQNNVAGSLYRNFADNCYGLLCALGLNGLANSLMRLMV